MLHYGYPVLSGERITDLLCGAQHATDTQRTLQQYMPCYGMALTFCRRRRAPVARRLLAAGLTAGAEQLMFVMEKRTLRR